MSDLGKLKEKVQKKFNEFIRLRDQKDGYFTCISCNQIKPVSQMNAGHYFSAGKNIAVTFDEANVNGQCIHCNHFEHANLVGYTKGMLKKYGQKEIDRLEIKRHNFWKPSRFELELIYKEYSQKIKELKK